MQIVFILGCSWTVIKIWIFGDLTKEGLKFFNKIVNISYGSPLLLYLLFLLYVMRAFLPSKIYPINFTLKDLWESFACTTREINLEIKLIIFSDAEKMVSTCQENSLLFGMKVEIDLLTFLREICGWFRNSCGPYGNGNKISHKKAMYTFWKFNDSVNFTSH